MLEAPLADLFSREGQQVGYHYAGPSWEAADGITVTRDQAHAVQMAAAPHAQDDIPWLLIKVHAAGDTEGAFTNVVYIQRVDAQGGQAPAEAPMRAGTQVGVAKVLQSC